MLDASAFDRDGFLRDRQQWTPALAAELAAKENISLSDAHWEILHLVRDYYARFDSSPNMRPLVKFCARELGPEKGKSIYLLSLFPGSPARLASKIAGLPKPDNCL